MALSALSASAVGSLRRSVSDLSDGALGRHRSPSAKARLSRRPPILEQSVSAFASEDPLRPLYSRGGSGVSTPSTIAEYSEHPELCWDTCPAHAEQAMLDLRKAAWHRSSEDLLSWPVTPDMAHDILLCAEMAEAAGDFGRRSAKFSHFTGSPSLLGCVEATQALCRDMDNGNPH